MFCILGRRQTSKQPPYDNASGTDSRRKGDVHLPFRALTQNHPSINRLDCRLLETGVPVALMEMREQSTNRDTSLACSEITAKVENGLKLKKEPKDARSDPLGISTGKAPVLVEATVHEKMRAGCVI
ncbi:hypothetical protein P7K49_027733 [Saguinus oedipus]|uniref:Uncharacterized protein n=1 Tax=Saguinus oedipus TaxID=9490 RepID=A0ABQ9UAF6_SAGOE|nr:hypothetical protein P7K49_027733 [Saguinus oedipus]